MSNATHLYAKERGLWIAIRHLPSGRLVRFKAMLKNFSDNFESNWNSEEVNGRMDPIETFQGTKRTIQIEWDVVAHDLYEAEDNLHKADLLSTFLYPVYSDFGNSNSITTAPLLRMKFSNLMQSAKGDRGLIGRLAGFQYTPDLDSGVFFSDKNLMCPQAITINATFHVLHEHSLGWNLKGDLREKRLPHRGDAALRNKSSREKSKKDLEKRLADRSTEAPRVFADGTRRLAATAATPPKSARTTKNLASIAKILDDKPDYGLDIKWPGTKE